MEDWKQILEFPSYSISSYGQVRNDNNGNLMSLTRNQRGIVNVGLMRNRVQYKRSVTVLVARNFLPRPRHETFDTPIQLNGDRADNRYFNLMWRPNWFAYKYHQQFDTPSVAVPEPIEETYSGEQFPNSWDVSIKYGVLDHSILEAILEKTYVWPTYQRFRLIR
jgi:hypothetical protein